MTFTTQIVKGTLEDYWLLHERVRHPGFHHLRKLYLDLGNSLDFSKLKCEICELAKNQRVSYPIGGKSNKILFSVITY